MDKGDQEFLASASPSRYWPRRSRHLCSGSAWRANGAHVCSSIAAAPGQACMSGCELGGLARTAFTEVRSAPYCPFQRFLLVRMHMLKGLALGRRVAVQFASPVRHPQVYPQGFKRCVMATASGGPCSFRFSRLSLFLLLGIPARLGSQLCKTRLGTGVVCTLMHIFGELPPVFDSWSARR